MGGGPKLGLVPTPLASEMALGEFKYRRLRDVLAITLTLSHYSVTTFSTSDQRGVTRIRYGFGD